MQITAKQIRQYRLCAHHLDKRLPASELLVAAGACGVQNSPPGAWETALLNRVENCTLKTLQDALYNGKKLLQAWSYRGVPVVFPANESDVFLTPLIAQAGEEPWIYTRGLTGALNFLQMNFDDLLARLTNVIPFLDTHTIKSKEALDQTLADLILPTLPQDKQPLWRAPSMYGNPDKQTVGGAAVSFLLRPCSFSSLVVFGARQQGSPTFTSYKNWMGHAPSIVPDSQKELVRKFLHCYGPTTVEHFASWLGCSPQQGRRLWHTVLDETVPVEVEGKTQYMLAIDTESLQTAAGREEELLLLGAHDPYLDLKDKTIILEKKALHQAVWKFVANPGAVVQGGRIIGTWKSKVTKDTLAISVTVWEPLNDTGQKTLKQLAEQYAAFRLMPLKNITLADI